MITPYRRIFTRAVLKRKATVDPIALIVLVFLGPFGTYEFFSFTERLIYWSAILIFCSVIFEICVPGILYHPRLVRKFSSWLRFVFGVSAGSFCAVWVIFVVEYLAKGGVEVSLIKLFFCAFVVGGVISFVSFLPALTHGPLTVDFQEINFERIIFFDIYPHLKGQRLRWISMEDHYARVFMEDSDEILHTSMQELEKQLENYPGMRVHRSHWVANAVVQGINKNGRKTMIDVGGDTLLPLGGKYQKNFDAAFEDLRFG
ncbi:MAG: LytTR family DNA-binding domain-containing protein [Litoreibacter sp.]